MQLYRISFPGLSEKSYIGITSKTASKRFKEHCSSRKKYPIVLAIKRYGSESAKLEVIAEFDSWDSLYEAEQIAIHLYGTKAPNGYNLTDGGRGCYGCAASDDRKRKIGEANKGRKMSDEQKKKISESNKARDLSKQVEAMADANRGKKLSAERRQGLIDIWTGRSHTEESRAKMSESASKRKASPETRAKMSAAIKGRKMSPESLAKRSATIARNRAAREAETCEQL